MNEVKNDKKTSRHTFLSFPSWPYVQNTRKWPCQCKAKSMWWWSDQISSWRFSDLTMNHRTSFFSSSLVWSDESSIRYRNRHLHCLLCSIRYRIQVKRKETNLHSIGHFIFCSRLTLISTHLPTSVCCFLRNQSACDNKVSFDLRSYDQSLFFMDKEKNKNQTWLWQITFNE